MSKRFGRQQRRRMRARVSSLEQKCNHLIKANNGFIAEHRALHAAINANLSGERISLLMADVRKRLS